MDRNAASSLNRRIVSVHRQLAQDESVDRVVFMYDQTQDLAVTFARPLDITLRFHDGPSTISFLSFHDEERSGGLQTSLRQLRERMDTYLIDLYGMNNVFGPGSLNFRFARAGGSVIWLGEEEHITVQQYLDSNNRVQVVMYPLGSEHEILAWDE